MWQQEVQGFSVKRVATNLCVDIATVHRTVKLFEATGCVSKSRSCHSTRDTSVKLSDPVKLTVLHFVLDRPGVYLWAIQQELKFIFNLDVRKCCIPVQILKKEQF